MKVVQQFRFVPAGAVLLILALSSVSQATAQGIPSPKITGFLRSLNSQDFFRQGHRQLEQELKRMERFSQLSPNALQVDPNAPIQEEELRELESKEPSKRKGDR